MLSRRKFLTLAAGSMAGSALIAACAVPAAPASTGSGAAAAKKTVVYWALQGENGDDNLARGIIKPFEEKNANVKINLQEVPWEGYYDKYQTLSAGGQAPDIAFVSAAWIEDFARLTLAS